MDAVAIVDSGGANIASLRYAFERLGVAARLTCDPREVRDAPRVILPGVAPPATRCGGWHRSGSRRSCRR